MKDYVKMILTGLFIIGAILFAGYVGYRLYNYAIQDATKKIRRGVAEGVGEGIGGSMNPVSWPKRMFGN